MSFRDPNACTVRSQSNCFKPGRSSGLAAGPASPIRVSPEEMPEVMPRATHHRDHRSSKGVEVGTYRTAATQNHYTIGRWSSEWCYTSLCSAFCSFTKPDQLGSE